MDIMILTCQISSYFCKDRNTGYNLRKNDTQDLVPNLVELMVLNIVFLTVL